MAKKMKKVDAAEPVEASVAVTERPEVYDERADAKEAEQKASFAAAALRAASDASVREPKTATNEAAAIAESRKSLLSPLGKDQKFFESPEGFILIGNADEDSIWCQKANKGKGMKINPRR